MRTNYKKSQFTFVSSPNPPGHNFSDLNGSFGYGRSMLRSPWRQIFRYSNSQCNSKRINKKTINFRSINLFLDLLTVWTKISLSLLGSVGKFDVSSCLLWWQQTKCANSNGTVQVMIDAADIFWKWTRNQLKFVYKWIYEWMKRIYTFHSSRIAWFG